MASLVSRVQLEAVTSGIARAPLADRSDSRRRRPCADGRRSGSGGVFGADATRQMRQPERADSVDEVEVFLVWLRRSRRMAIQTRRSIRFSLVVRHCGYGPFTARMRVLWRRRRRRSPRAQWPRSRPPATAWRRGDRERGDANVMPKLAHWRSWARGRRRKERRVACACLLSLLGGGAGGDRGVIDWARWRRLSEETDDCPLLFTAKDLCVLRVVACAAVA